VAVRYAVRAHPRAARPRVILAADDTIEVWVTAPAVEGRANAALVTALAERLGLRSREVVLVRGERGRNKIVELPLDLASLRRALAGG
jgi:uncharacterized protein (TIGR00251 family)